MKRRTTDEEKALFRKHVEGAPSLKAVTPKPAARKAAAIRSTGLDGNTSEKLRKGRIAPGARIDLHGMTGTAPNGCARATAS